MHPPGQPAGLRPALEEGALDDAIAAYLALTSRRRVLSSPEQTTRPGLYDRMDAPAQLLAPERDPQTGHYESPAAETKRTLVRPGKRNGQDQAAPKAALWVVRRAAVIGVAAAVVLAGAGAATAVLSRAQSGPIGNPPAVVSVQPSVLSFPADPVHVSITRPVTVTGNRGSPATITGVSIGGPDRQDFSILDPDLLDAARYGRRAIGPVAPLQPCHRRAPHAQTCTITVVFTPSAPGTRTADLRIYLASALRSQDIALSGTGIIVPPPSSVPMVAGVFPASGPVAGGTSVTITGAGFTGATGVRFGGRAATRFTVDSATQITATSPPGAAATTVDVTVTTPAGTSAAADKFSYTAAALSSALQVALPVVAGVSPASGPVTGGTTVTITGTGFTGATGVRFGRRAATRHLRRPSRRPVHLHPHHRSPGDHQRRHRHLFGGHGGHLHGDHDGPPDPVDQQDRHLA